MSVGISLEPGVPAKNVSAIILGILLGLLQ